MTKRIITYHRLWRCFTCGKAETTPITTPDPICCRQYMRAEREIFSGGDPQYEQLDLVECAAGDDQRAPDHVFHVPSDWDPAYEVWVLREGRMKGERLGWLGKGLLGWSYEMVPGIPEYLKRGFKPTREEAIAAMRYAIEGH